MTCDGEDCNNNKVSWECPECGEQFCDDCCDDSLGECPKCSPPELYPIRKNSQKSQEVKKQ